MACMPLDWSTDSTNSNLSNNQLWMGMYVFRFLYSFLFVAASCRRLLLFLAILFFHIYGDDDDHNTDLDIVYICKTFTWHNRRCRHFCTWKKGKKLNEQKQTNKQLNHILSASAFSHLFIYLFLVFHALDYNSIKFLFICYCCDFDVTFSLYLIT